MINIPDKGLEELMEYFEKDFGKILKNNAQQMRHNLLPEITNCFRVYDRNLSQFPVTVDIYGKYAKVTDYKEDAPLDEELKKSCLDICSRMLYLEPENIIYTYRAKRETGQQHEKSQDPSIVVEVLENNLKFKVNLTTYVDTGLFLDHRLTRMLIKERSACCDVLNLFSYTGSFSVYAAAGLANSVKSVDLSATYTKWAQENLANNGYDGPSYECLCMDALKYVQEALEKGEKYDIIIFDPPSFSNSRKMESTFDVSRDYALWIKALSKLMKKTGFILFSTNLGSFSMDKRRLRNLRVKEITGALEAPGFSKSRKGTARSWIMAFDEDSLKLDWSEPKEKSSKGTGKSSEKRSERKSEQGVRKFGTSRRSDRTYKTYKSGRDSQGERSYKSKRDDNRLRDYRKEDRDSRDVGYNDRYNNRYNRDNRDNRRRSYDSYDGRGYRRDNRENRTYEEDRYRDSDRSRRFKDYRDKDSYSGRRSSQVEYRGRGEDKFEGFGRHSRDEREDRQEWQDRRDRRSGQDRPNRRDRENSKSFRSSSSYKASSYNMSKSSKKPYGFDSFKPARSRDDSSDFFWNTDDLDVKPNKEG